MRKLNAFAYALIGFYAVFAAVQYFTNDEQEDSRHLATLHQELERMANTINSDLPMQLDAVTALMRVQVKDTTIIQHLEISDAADEATSMASIAALSDQIIDGACLDPLQRELLSRGATIKHIYKTKSGKDFFTHEVSERECQ